MTTSGTTLARLRSPAVLVAQNGASLAIPNYMADEVEQSRASIVAQMVQHSFTRPARPSYASAPQYFPESVEEEPCGSPGGDDGGQGGHWSPGPASPAQRGKHAPLRQGSSDMVARGSSATRAPNPHQPYTTPSSPFRSNTSTSDSAAFSGAAPHSAAQTERSSHPAAFSSERRPLSANANTQAHPARCTAATQPGVDLVAAVTGKIIQQYDYDEDSLDEEELACDLEAAQDTLARALEMARSSSTAVTRMAAPDSPSSRLSAGSSVSRRSHTTQQHQHRGSGNSRHNSTQLQLVELEITPAPSNDGPSSKQPLQQQQYQLPQPRRLSNDAYTTSRGTAGGPSPSPGSATGSHPRPWSAGGVPGPSGHSATGARPGSAIFGAGGAGGGILDQRRGLAGPGAAAGQAPGQAGLVTCGSGDMWSLHSTSPLASRATSCLSVAASGSSQVGPGAHGGPAGWLAGSAGSISAQMNQGPSPWFSSAPGPSAPRSNVATSSGSATRGSAGGAGGARTTGPAYGTAQGAVDAEAGESAATERVGGIGRFHAGDAGGGAASASAGTSGGPERSTASASAGSSIKGLFKLAKKAFRRSIGGGSPAAAAAMDAAAAAAASRESGNADSDGGAGSGGGSPLGASPQPQGGGPSASGGSMVVAGSSVSAVSTRSTRSVGGAVPSAYAAPASPLLVRPATIVPPPASPPPLSSGPSITQQQQGYRMSGSTPHPQLPPKLSVQLPEPPSPPVELRGSAPSSGVSGSGSGTGAGATLGVRGRLSLELQSGMSPTLPPPPSAAGCRTAPPPPLAVASAGSPTASQASACEAMGPVVEGEASLFASRQPSGGGLAVSVSAGGAGGGGGSGGPSPPPASPPGGTAPASWSGASIRRRQSVVAGTASELQVTAHVQSFLQGRQQQQQLLHQMKQQQGSACDSPASGECGTDSPVITGPSSHASSASKTVGGAGGATGQGVVVGVGPVTRVQSRGVGGGEQMPESLGHLHAAQDAEGTAAAAGPETVLGPRPTRLAGAAAAACAPASPPPPTTPVTGTSPAARSPAAPQQAPATPRTMAAAPLAAAKSSGGPAASPGHLARPAVRSSHSAGSGSSARSSSHAPASAGGSQAGSGAVSPRPPPRTVPGAVTGGAVRGAGTGLSARGAGLPGGRPGVGSASGAGAPSSVV